MTGKTGRDDLNAEALRAFVKIAIDWKLSFQQIRSIIGGVSPITYNQWREAAQSNKPVKMPRAALNRLTHVITVRVGINQVFRDPDDQAAWLRRKSAALGGCAPINFMCKSDEDLVRVVRLVTDLTRSLRVC